MQGYLRIWNDTPPAKVETTYRKSLEVSPALQLKGEETLSLSKNGSSPLFDNRHSDTNNQLLLEDWLAQKVEARKSISNNEQ